MSEPDRFDEEAAEMLPCSGNLGCSSDNSRECPAYYRPAVAARLRADAKQYEDLKADRHAVALNYLQADHERVELRAEIERLHTQLAVSEKDRQRLIDSNEHWHIRVTQIEGGQ